MERSGGGESRGFAGDNAHGMAVAGEDFFVFERFGKSGACGSTRRIIRKTKNDFIVFYAR